MNRVSNIKFKGEKDELTKYIQSLREFLTKADMEKGNAELHIKAAIILTAFFTTYLAIVFQLGSGPYWLVFKIALMGFLAPQIGFNVMHDAAHGSFSKNHKVNALMAFTLNILGGNAFIWDKKHNQIHHSFTNIHEHDDDPMIGPIARLNEHQKWRPYHQYQHRYLWIAYALSYWLWIYVLDFSKFVRKKVRAKPMKMERSDKRIFWWSKILHWTMFIIIPMLTSYTWYEVLLGYFAYVLITGFIISIVFQPAHVVLEADVVDEPHPSADKPSLGIVEQEFYEHQLNTTVNFAADSKLAHILTGGLNQQVEHHLFPHISHVYYPYIRTQLKKWCIEHNYPYKEIPTFWGALVSHYRLLKKYGKKPMQVV